MYEILEAKELAGSIYKYVVKAPRCAASCEPGQFVIVRTFADSERVPLTVCDYDREAGTVTIVVQVIGASTYVMKELKAGDAVLVKGSRGMKTDEIVNAFLKEG
mgnify:CR=1 FL=1